MNIKRYSVNGTGFGVRESSTGDYVTYDEHAEYIERLKKAAVDSQESGFWGRAAAKEANRANKAEAEVARLKEQVRALAAESAAMKDSRSVLAENALETCNAVYCAGYRNDDIHRGLMQSTGNGNKYPNPIKSLVDESLRSLETPATYATLNEVRAQGAIDARNALVVAGDGADIYAVVTEVVARIRAGEVPNG